MKHYGDITQLKGHDVEIVDVVTGGSPCQDLSVAGLRKGLAGERSGLFMEQIRIIREMRNEFLGQLRSRGTVVDIRHISPRYMVWENVVGAFTSNNCEDFRAVLEETAKITDPTATIPRPKGGWKHSGAIMGNGWSIAWRVHDAQFWGVPQRRKRIALVADFNGETAPEILFERKGVSRDIGESREEREETTADTRESTLHTISFQERSGREGGGKGILIQDEHVGALKSTNHQKIYSFVGGVDFHHMTMTGNVGMTIRSVKSDTDHIPCVCFEMDNERRRGIEETGDVSPCLTRRMGTGGNNTPTVIKGGEQMVRKLTPLECERLQGYPDNWTQIGEWTDSKGKKRQDSDTARYKALGNSIALPFWEWMAQRICDQYDRPVKMASLFDGIGGFPLVFSRCGAEPVWASEIEDFPIAVTKVRFPEE